MMWDARSIALGWDLWRLGIEAGTVIAIRTSRLALLDARAAVEADRMVAEKVEAWLELYWRALTGGLGRSREAIAAGTVRHYRTRVNRNLRRLTAPG